jgi:AraC family transcriptional regulator
MRDEFFEPGAHAPDDTKVAALYPPAPRAVRRALDYIHANLASNVRLADIAGAARMSVYHFSRTFSKAMGIGPHRYLLQARVERVKALLRAGDRTLASIADETGFSDQSHMSKVFRKSTGWSPKAYRAQRPAGHCPLKAYFDSLRRTDHVQ